jgi:hypothetical protein
MMYGEKRQESCVFSKVATVLVGRAIWRDIRRPWTARKPSGAPHWRQASQKRKTGLLFGPILSEKTLGFLDRVIGRKHPSATWQAQAGLELQLDLDGPALCRCRIGDPIEWLSGLGPPEDSEALREHRYCYYSRGVEIGEDKGTVADFAVFWIDYLQAGFQPFSGLVTYRGKTVPLDSRTTEDAFRAMFSDPYWRYQDQDETILFYEFQDDIEWQVEFTLTGSLKAMRLVLPALMADAKQREMYGVSLPWPPRRD